MIEETRFDISDSRLLREDYGSTRQRSRHEQAEPTDHLRDQHTAIRGNPPIRQTGFHH